MATFSELAAQGYSKLRLPGWNPSAYLQLDLLEGGQYGPWAKLRDPISEEAMRTVAEQSGKEYVPPRMDVLVFDVDCGDWEPYTEPNTGGK